MFRKDCRVSTSLRYRLNFSRGIEMMMMRICLGCPYVKNCGKAAEECNRNDIIYNLLMEEITKAIADFHRILTEIEDDGDE